MMGPDQPPIVIPGYISRYPVEEDPILKIFLFAHISIVSDNNMNISNENQLFNNLHNLGS